jgi:AraC-like DNA-binding protein
MAQLAAETGFADQAHFCRAIRQLTGAPPSAWQQVKSVQDAARAAALE